MDMPAGATLVTDAEDGRRPVRRAGAGSGRRSGLAAGAEPEVIGRKATDEEEAEEK